MSITAPEIIQPAYLWVPPHTTTAGPDVADFGESIGMVADPEQRLALDAMWAETPAGKWAAFEAAIVAPRQQIKTFLFELGALADVFVFDLRLVIFSAHEFSTALESFRSMKFRIETYPHLSRQVKKISEANGEEAIELHGDRRIRFRARTKSGGRGLTGDKVYLDEAFALTPSIIGSVMPIMSAKSMTGNPQILYGSSAGKVDAHYLRSVRDRGRAGGSSSLAWIEWCAPVTNCRHDRCDHKFGTSGCALDDRRLWHLANFAMNRRISEAHIAKEREAMPPEEFARERLGWWEEPEKHGSGIDLELWESNARPRAQGGALKALAVEVAEDSSWAAVAAARDRGDGGLVVDVIGYRKGTDWCAALIREARGDSGVPVAAHSDGPASVVCEDLAAESLPVHERIEVTAISLKDMARACAGLIDGLDRRTRSHRSQPHLDFAVKGSVRQPMSEGWRWSRKSSSIDISPLAAVTWAQWAAKLPVQGPREPWVAFG